MKPLSLEPTENQTFIIACSDRRYDLRQILAASYRAQDEGNVEKACQMRYEAAGLIADLIPDDEDICLEWSDEQAQAAAEILYASSIDHFLIGDAEMSTAQLEMLLDIDPEDHFGAIDRLAVSYLALGEYASAEELLPDLSDKEPSTHVVRAFLSFERDGTIDADTADTLRRRFAPCVEEFCSTEHPVNEEYVQSLDATHPSPRMSARRLWLQTEPLWLQKPRFIEALRRLQK